MDNIESFLSHDDDNSNSTNTPFNDPKGHHNAITKNEHKGNSFGLGKNALLLLTTI